MMGHDDYDHLRESADADAERPATRGEDRAREWYAWEAKRNRERLTRRIAGCVALLLIGALIWFLAIAGVAFLTGLVNVVDAGATPEAQCTEPIVVEGGDVGISTMTCEGIVWP